MARRYGHERAVVIADHGDGTRKGAVDHATVENRLKRVAQRLAHRGRGQGFLRGGARGRFGGGRARSRTGGAGSERNREERRQQHSGSVTMHCRGQAGWRMWLSLVGIAFAGCAAATGSHAEPGSNVRPGISVLLADSLHLIRGRAIGLLTNQTGVDEHGESDIELLRGDRARGAGVRLVTLFSPEHGIRGTEDRTNLASGIDERSGLAVNSLYTTTTIAPPDSTLRGVDALVVDLQDIGTRTWTYVGSMLYTM